MSTDITRQEKGMTSLEIAETTGRRHSDVMRDIRTILEQGASERNFALASYFDKQGKTRPMYELTAKGCLILASGYNVVLREKIIDKLEEYRSKEKQESFQVPQSFSEALMLAAKQQQLIEQQKKEIEAAAPKVEFFDAVADSKDAIAMEAVAKTLNFRGVGRNKLFEILREKQILLPNNMPYQKYIDRGYFRTIEQKYTIPTGETRISIKTLVFQKGVNFIQGVLLHLGYIYNE